MSAFGNRRSLQYFFDSRPDWWALSVSAVSWFVLIFHAITSSQHASHLISHRLGYGVEIEHWMLMVAAMMIPFTNDRLQFVAEYSLWHRRHRAIAGFLLGYFAPWLGIGLFVAAIRAFDWSHSWLMATVVFLMAALWQRTKVHNRAVLNCHLRFPLSPSGWKADKDCLHYGAVIGTSCVISCWLVMIACTFTGHNLLVMAGGVLISDIERRSHRPKPGRLFAVTLSLAVACLIREFV